MSPFRRPSVPLQRRWCRVPLPPLFLLLLGAGGLGLVGCSGDTSGTAPILPAAQLYGALVLNQHAVNLDTAPPYNTVQLTATPTSLAGTPLPVGGSGRAVIYQVTDSSVTVSPSGLVIAHSPTSQAEVIASLTVQGVTQADTVYVQVTPGLPPAPLTTFSIQPAAGDSAKTALLYFRSTVPVYATDAAGAVLCNADACSLLVHFTSSDPTIATIDPILGTITPIRVGHVTFTATTLAYGVAKRDTLPYVIGYPFGNLSLFINVQASTPVGGLTPVLSLAPASFTVGVGAIVYFRSELAQPIDVVFDDSTAVDSAEGNPQGNIHHLSDSTLFPFFGVHGYDVRRFPIAGSYPYRTQYGTSGTIVVSGGP
jgi:hypothetical protein